MTVTTPRKPSPRAVTQKNWYSLSNLKILSEELKRLEKEDRELYLRTFSLILKSGIARFAGYIERQRKQGMIAIQSAAKWINDSGVENFRNRETLLANFRLNQESFGEVWYRRWQVLQDESEYLEIIRKIIRHPNSYKMIWNEPSLRGAKPRLGYLYKESQQKPILVVIDQDGFIERAEVLRPIWQSILARMNDFYKIDNFPDSFLNPIC